MSIPFNQEAEQALVGDMLVGFTDCIEHVSERLCSSDFYVPAHGNVFDAIVRLHRQGARVDAVTVADELHRRGQDCDIVELQLHGSSAWRKHTEIVLRYSLARRLISAGSELVEAAKDVTRDPVDTLLTAKSILAAIDLPVGTVPADLYDRPDLTDLEQQPVSAWVIPGIARVGWRVLFVGFEGKGKSVLLTQIAGATAAGIDPFRNRPIPPQPTLLVDLENPRDVVADRLRKLPEGKESCMIWHRPAGINVRRRADRAEFEKVIEHSRPKLVCIGPLYKLYRSEARESDETAALEVQAILDDLRERYGFALLIEHHAPHADAGTKRKARPYGSSLWLRWPEFGIGLEDSTARRGSLELTRFRSDRVKASWPDRIDRGGTLPWSGYWANGGEF
jgi:replicative DNA helicase